MLNTKQSYKVPDYTAKNLLSTGGSSYVNFTPPPPRKPIVNKYGASYSLHNQSGQKMTVQEMQKFVSSNATLFTPAESQALLEEIRRGDPMTEMIFEYYATNGDREFLVRRLKNAIGPKLLSNSGAN